MILSIFLFLFLLGVFFIVIPNFIEVNDTTFILRMVGSLIVMLLGLSIMSQSFFGFTSGIQYKIGENETYVYGDNYTTYHWDYDYSSPNPNAPQALFHKYTYDVYDTYTNPLVGFFFAILGGFSFALTFIELRQYRREE